MLKNFVLVLVVASFVFGCQAQKPPRVWYEANGKLKVLSTIAMIHDLVQDVGGDYVDAMPLICGELDPHSYELVKGDDEKFARADVIFYNGLGLEHGLSLRQNLEGNPKACAVTAHLLETCPEQVLIADGQYDPHVWMDIALWMTTLNPITEALCQADPAHADYYQERAARLHAQMAEADTVAFTRLQVVPKEKRYLVTSHDAFNYFTRHYLAEPGEEGWSVRCAAPEGLAPEAQMSVADILEIISHVERFGVTVLFPESNVSQDALRKIVKSVSQKGRTLRLCQEALYGDAMGKAESYLAMICHNVDVIARGLEGSDGE